MHEAFIISDDLLEQYQQLVFDENAQMHCCYIPLASAFWEDEHPGGHLSSEADKVSQRSIYRLIEARRSFWDKHEISRELERLWLEAKSLIPEWPGFRRMELSEAERKYIDQCEATSEEFWAAFIGGADEVEVIDHEDGTVQWSATFNLEEEKKPGTPWWKFWKRR